QRDLIGRGPVGRIPPLELVGRHISDGGRIELDRSTRGGKAQGCDRNGRREVAQRVMLGHPSLPQYVMHAESGATLACPRICQKPDDRSPRAGHFKASWRAIKKLWRRLARARTRQ